MQFTAILLVLAAAICMVNGLCNTCAPKTGIACVGNDRLQICVDGIKTGPVITCPQGSLCSIDGPICKPDDGTVSSSCARCNKCNAANIFACTSYTEFAFCSGGGVPAGAHSYPCGTGLVCNIDAPNICVNSTETMLGATCPLPIEPTRPVPPITEAPETGNRTTLAPTTPNPATSPEDFCKSIKTAGLHEIPAHPTQYVSCILLNGIWQGSVFECPKGFHFSKSATSCVKDQPAN